MLIHRKIKEEELVKEEEQEGEERGKRKFKKRGRRSYGSYSKLF